MPGWLSEASSFASRSKRASRSGSAASAAGSTFSATSRPSLVSVARYTSPMPPAPIGATTSYAPRRLPGDRLRVTLLSGSERTSDAARSVDETVDRVHDEEGARRRA